MKCQDCMGAGFNPGNEIQLSRNAKVSKLMLPGTRVWNRPLVHRTFDWESYEAIMRIRPLPEPHNDELIWKDSNNGQFSVKVAYWRDQNRRFMTHQQLWRNIWKAKIHERQKLLVWRAAQDILPSKERLGRIMGTKGAECPWCGEGAESTLHLLKECHVAKFVWFAAPSPIRVEDVRASSVFSFIEGLFCKFEPPDKLSFLGSVVCVIDVLWNVRNNSWFAGTILDTMEVRLKSDEHSTLLARQKDI